MRFYDFDHLCSLTETDQNEYIVIVAHEKAVVNEADMTDFSLQNREGLLYYIITNVKLMQNLCSLCIRQLNHTV